MADTEYTAALQMLITRIDAQDTAAARREELLTKINGFVRDHGEQLAAQKQWIWGHKQTHEALDKDVHNLSNRLWILSGGTGVLSVVAAILQFMNL
jgi:hypothetical protein